MLKKWVDDSPLKLKSDAKINDIFYETKKIVYSTHKYNDYMKKTTNTKNFFPEIINNKNQTNLPIGDNFIHLSKSSLTLSKEKIFTHNSIKNVKQYFNQNEEKNNIKTERGKDLDTLLVPSVLDKINNTKSRNLNNQYAVKDTFYATSLNKLMNHQFKNTITHNPTNDFYWDNKQETYFTLKKGKVEVLKEILLQKIKFLKENPCHNYTYFYSKTHNEGTKNSITYFLRSFQIFLRNTNMNSSFSLKNLELYIPFFLVPIIYLLDDYNLISFITYTTKLNEKLSEISFDYDKVYDFINVYFENTNKEAIKPYNHFHTLKFDWVTTNIAFDVSLKMPIIEIFYDSSNLKICKVLDIDIMIQLHKTGFISWDNEVVNYLNQIKIFRQIINNTFSKLKLATMKKSEIGHREKFLDSNIIKDNYFNEKNIFFIFAFTDKNLVNKLVTFKSYHIVCYFKKVQLLTDLNFKQLNVLQKISQSYKIENFIRKLIIIDNKEPYISFDFQYFENIDDNYFKYFGKNNLITDKVRDSHLIIEVKNPFYQVREFNKNTFILNEYEIESHVIDELVKRDIGKWKYVFLENTEGIQKTIFDYTSTFTKKRDALRRDPDAFGETDVNDQGTPRNNMNKTKIISRNVARFSRFDRKYFKFNKIN